MHSEFAGFVGSGRHYSALMALASDNNRFPFQRGIEQLFHRDKKGVHVYVEDGAGESSNVGNRSHAMRILAAAVAVSSAAEPRASRPFAKLSGQPGECGLTTITYREFQISEKF